MWTTIVPAVSYGPWQGWGCSLAWWAKAFGNRDDLADLLFSRAYVTLGGVELPGLGFNVARYNAGACSWNTVGNASMHVSPNMIPERQMEGFWIDPSNKDPLSTSWDWSVDKNQIDMLRKAKSRGADTFELFSNSPMWWMLENYNPSGSQSGRAGNLREDQRSNFVTYMSEVAAHAASAWGVEMAYIEMFNEPMSDWWTSDNNQEGCHFSTEAQSSIIAILNEAEGMAGRISASDENSYTLAIDTWRSLSSSTKSKISKVNVHGYEYEAGRRDVLYDETAGHVLWNSEYGEGDASGISLLTNLNLDFRWLHQTAWLYWQPLDGGGWGLIQSELSSGWIGPANLKYYALAHYSRHILPGMSVLDGGSDNCIAAYEADASKLVIVSSVLESSAFPVEVCYNMSHFGQYSGHANKWVTYLQDQSSELYRYYENGVYVSSNLFCSSFSSVGIQTFELVGVVY